MLMLKDFLNKQQKQYLLKLGEIEQAYNQRRKESGNYTDIQKIFKRSHHHSSDSFRSFEWTPVRQQTFDGTMQHLLDDFYNLIHQMFQDGEFDRDQYAYFDDSTRQIAANLPNPYERLQMQPMQNNYGLPRSTYL